MCKFADKPSEKEIVDKIFKARHIAPTEVHSGINPIRATGLCAVVDQMYSNEQFLNSKWT